MKTSLKAIRLSWCLLLVMPLVATASERLINHVEYRFACLKGQVKLEVRAPAQDWFHPTNRCGEQTCRTEYACASDEGRAQLQGHAPFERITLDLACYGGRLYRRQIDFNGYFKIQRYEGKPPFGCNPKDNRQFTASYFIPEQTTTAADALGQK